MNLGSSFNGRVLRTVLAPLTFIVLFAIDAAHGSTAIQTLRLAGSQPAILSSAGEEAYYHSVGVAQEVAFVDASAVPETWPVTVMRSGVEAVRVPAQSDAWALIAATLRDRHGLTAIHFIGHGEPGRQHLGASVLDGAALAGHATELGLMRRSLGRDGELLLWGCDVASGEAGRSLVYSLARQTGARVAASTDPTGAEARGGNWRLEFTSASFRVSAPFTAERLATFPDLLAAGTVTFSTASSTDLGTHVSDGQGGSADLPGIVLDIYTATTASPDVTDGSHLVNYTAGDLGTTVGGLASDQTMNPQLIVIKSGGTAFSLRSIQVISTGGDLNVTFQGFLGGVSTGPAVTGSIDGGTFVSTFSQADVLTPAQFQNVDEIRITDPDFSINTQAINAIVIGDPVLPLIVTTAAAADVTETTVTLGGEVTSNGGPTVIERGVVYATTADPTTSDNKVTAPGTTGAFTVGVSGLTGSTLYHFRAYAIDGVDTIYGGDVTFTTLAPKPVITSAGSAAGVYGSAFTPYTITASGNPVSFGATGLPPGLSLAAGVITGTPTQSGVFSVILSAADLAGNVATAPLTLTVAKAPLLVTADPKSRAYGAADPAFTTTITGFVNGDTLATSGVAGIAALSTPATAASAVGTYPIVATTGTLTADNYSFTFADGMLTLTPAPLTVTANDATRPFGVANPAFTATITGFVNGDTAATATTGTASLTTTATVASPAGTYPIVAGLGTLAATNYSFASFLDGTLTITPAGTTATITLSDLRQAYDGTPKSPTVVTDPAGLAVTFTYDGVPTPPTLPGSYAVVATIADPNYTGSATGTLAIVATALVRHGPTLNGDLDGSLQVLLPDSFTLNGSGYVSGDLLVPGTPTIRLNGHPTLVGVVDGSGSAAPASATITLNGNAVVRYIVRRTDPIALPVVSAPQAPAGTRNVTLNTPAASAGDFATLRNLTLNSNAGLRAVPAGAYGTFIANGSSGFVLGTIGATTPSVYHLQQLVLNGGTTLQVVGPVIVRLAQGASFNGVLGSAEHPEWLAIEIYSGGVTLNGSATLHGCVVAPNGTVTVNGNAGLHGGLAADRLTLNGGGLVTETTP